MESNTGNGGNGTMPAATIGAGVTQDGNTPERMQSAPAHFLSRDAILSAKDITYEDVVVPEWNNGSVRVKALTAGQRDALEQSCMVTEGKRQVFKAFDFRAKLVVRTACDENLRLLFAEEDIPALTAKAAGPVNRLADVAMRLSKITEADVDEIVKSSGSGPSAVSSSGSPSSGSAVSRGS